MRLIDTLYSIVEDGEDSIDEFKKDVLKLYVSDYYIKITGVGQKKLYERCLKIYDWFVEFMNTDEEIETDKIMIAGLVPPKNDEDDYFYSIITNPVDRENTKPETIYEYLFMPVVNVTESYYAVGSGDYLLFEEDILAIFIVELAVSGIMAENGEKEKKKEDDMREAMENAFRRNND